MFLTKDFERTLFKLWRRRIENIESLVKSRKGRPLYFRKYDRDRGIKQLEELANQIVTKQGAKKELNSVTVYRKTRQISGTSFRRQSRLIQLAKTHLKGAIIYAFWKNRRCMYVGKGKSWKRLLGYQNSVYLHNATRISVRGISGPSQLGKAECLSKHLFNPQYNKITPAKTKHGKPCPVCKAKRQIRLELRSLFRLK